MCMGRGMCTYVWRLEIDVKCPLSLSTVLFKRSRDMERIQGGFQPFQPRPACPAALTRGMFSASLVLLSLLKRLFSMYSLKLCRS